MEFLLLPKGNTGLRNTGSLLNSPNQWFLTRTLSIASRRTDLGSSFTLTAVLRLVGVFSVCLLREIPQLWVVREDPVVVANRVPENIPQSLIRSCLFAQTVETQKVVVKGRSPQQGLLHNDTQLPHFGEDLVADVVHDVADDLLDHLLQLHGLGKHLELFFESQSLAAQFGVSLVALVDLLDLLVQGQRGLVVVFENVRNFYHVSEVLVQVGVVVNADEALGEHVLDSLLILVEVVLEAEQGLYLKLRLQGQRQVSPSTFGGENAFFSHLVDFSE